MAQTRLEKVGTIYSRVISLLKTGAIKEESTPLWLPLYKAFPPKYEPRYDRPGLKTPLRQIFYKEDRIRAKFHEQYKYFSMVNMLDNARTSKTEQFLLIYKQLEREGIPEEELYDKAIKEFMSQVQTEKIEREAMDADKSQRRKNVKSTSGAEVKAEAVTSSELSKEELKQYKPIRLSMEKLFENDKDDEKKSE